MKKLRLVCLSLLLLFALTANASAGVIHNPGPEDSGEGGEVLTPPSDGGDILNPPAMAYFIASLLGL